MGVYQMDETKGEITASGLRTVGIALLLGMVFWVGMALMFLY